MPNSPQVLFADARNITVYGFKFEYAQELLNITHSGNIRIIGGSGNYELVSPDDRAIIVIEDSSSIEIQNLARKGMTSEVVFMGKPAKDVTKFWIVDGTVQLPGDYGVLLYKDIKK